jgi:hypothetical protein
MTKLEISLNKFSLFRPKCDTIQIRLKTLQFSKYEYELLFLEKIDNFSRNVMLKIFKW